MIAPSTIFKIRSVFTLSYTFLTIVYCFLLLLSFLLLISQSNVLLNPSSNQLLDSLFLITFTIVFFLAFAFIFLLYFSILSCFIGYIDSTIFTKVSALISFPSFCITPLLEFQKISQKFYQQTSLTKISSYKSLSLIISPSTSCRTALIKRYNSFVSENSFIPGPYTIGSLTTIVSMPLFW